MVYQGNIIMRFEKAYICVEGKTDSGLYIDMDPVFISGISIDEIKANLEKVQAFGHPRVELLTKDDQKKAAKVMLKATGAKSWKELGRTGFCYSISENEDSSFLHMTRLDKQGRWVYDPKKTHNFPPDTPIERIIQIAIDDYFSHK